MFVEALSPLKTSVVDVAVLLLTAIVVVVALRPALWAVNVKVAVATPVPAEESLGAGSLRAVGLLVHTNGSLVDSLAGRPLDRAGAIERGDVRRVTGVDRILHVACSDVFGINNVSFLGVRSGVSHIRTELPAVGAIPNVADTPADSHEKADEGQCFDTHCR